MRNEDKSFFSGLVGMNSRFQEYAVRFGAAVGNDGKHYALLDYPSYFKNESSLLYEDSLGDSVVQYSCEEKRASAVCAEDGREYRLNWGGAASDDVEIFGDEYGIAVFVYTDAPNAAVMYA